MSDVLLKYESYPGNPKGDATTDAAAAREELKAECDKLLESTKENLRGLMSSQVGPSREQSEKAMAAALEGRARSLCPTAGAHVLISVAAVVAFVSTFFVGCCCGYLVVAVSVRDRHGAGQMRCIRPGNQRGGSD